MGHLKTINFPFGTNGKFIILGVPILKHIRVIWMLLLIEDQGLTQKFV